MRAAEALRWAAQQLSRAGVDDPWGEATWLAAEALGSRREDLHAHPERELSPRQLERLQQLVRRRAQGEPLAYVLGRWEFFGLELEVNEAVLVPRPETERLVEEAVRLAPPGGRVLEVGTGCGAVALALRHERPDLGVVATDVSLPALQVAARNARRHRLRLPLVAADALEALRGGWDLILSNPPYVARGEWDRLPREVLREPRLALDGGVNGLRLHRRLIEDAPGLLRPRGWLLLEVGWNQGQRVADLMRARGFGEVEVLADLAGRPRVVRGRWSG